MSVPARPRRRAGVPVAWVFSILTILLFGVRVVGGVGQSGWDGVVTVLTVFSAFAAIGAILWVVLVGRLRARAAAVAQAAPGGLLVMGDRNIDVRATLRLVFGVEHVPGILAWTFDAEGASLWGAKPAQGPVLRLEREQATAVGQTMVSGGRESFPGMKIMVHDHRRGVDRPIPFFVRDPAHPTRPCNAEHVRQQINAVRALWQLTPLRE